MPTRFPTQAANADFIGEDPDQNRETQSSPPAGAQGGPQADGALAQPRRSRRAPRAEPTPGKELNEDPKDG